MATDDDLDRHLRRVTRDLRAPMALLVADAPRRRVVAHQGFEHVAAMRRLLSFDLVEQRVSDCSARSVSVGLRSYAHSDVSLEGRRLGSLFVADRRRRWFDDDEVHHLGLLTAVAATLLEELRSDVIEAVDLEPALMNAVDVRDVRSVIRVASSA